MTLLTRREITLLLFALSAFIIGYNFHYASNGSSASTDWEGGEREISAKDLLGKQGVLREDGRRDTAYEDTLEQKLMGTWVQNSRPSHVLGPHAETVGTQQRVWADGNIPATVMVAHVPGYTILDNVLLANGTLYIIADNAADSFPKSESIISKGLESPYPPVTQDLNFMPRNQAIQQFGYSVHRTVGTSVICFDQKSAIDNYTFLALHRAHATLSSGIALRPPDRIMFTNLLRSMINEAGYSLELARMVTPYTVHLFAENWVHMEQSMRPMFFERVLLADRVSAANAEATFDFERDTIAPLASLLREKKEDAKKQKSSLVTATHIEPTDRRISFSPAFSLPAPANWDASLRGNVYSLLVNPEYGAEVRKAITYVSTQKKSAGPRLRNSDHKALVQALRALASSRKWDVHVIELGLTSCIEQARAIAQSSVIIGVYGDVLAQNVFLRSDAGPRAVLEIFPDGRFANENEFLSRALGVDYFAWHGRRKYGRGSLPPVSLPSAEDERELAIDVSSVVQTVKEILRS